MFIDPIDGGEARLWPFTPNWRNSVDVELAYKTDIFTARAGREQRRALRKAPRRSIGFTVTLNTSQQRHLHCLMTEWQSRTWILADTDRSMPLDDALTEGATEIPLSEVPFWLDNAVALYLGDDLVVNIADVDADGLSVTLSEPLPVDVAAGTLMRPALFGYIDASLRVNHPSSGACEFAITFSVKPGSEGEDVGLVGGDRVLDSREVLTMRPNWGAAVQSEFNWAPEQVDFGFGRIATYNPLAFGTMVRRATFVRQGPDDILALKQFFARRRGQAGEFLMPTWLNDLPPLVALEAGDNTLTVAGTEVLSTYADDPIYKAVAVMLRDGRQIYRKIESIALSGDEANSVLTLATPWSSDIALSDIAMVCWLPVVRFGSDALTIEYLTSTVAQVQFAMRTLEYLPPDDDLPFAFDEAALWVLDAWGEDEFLDLEDPLDQIINDLYPEIF